MSKQMRTIAAGLTMSAAIFVANGAVAADLGGNCCADLEERVAELEAMTVRKGNRKVSLEISGFTGAQLVYWNDGGEKNTYVTDPTVPGRFRFTGAAKIDSNTKAGYLLEIGMMAQTPLLLNRDTSRTPSVAGLTPFQVRHSAWWLENKNLGKLTVGQTAESTESITEINVSGTQLVSAPSTTTQIAYSFVPRQGAVANKFGATVGNVFGNDAPNQIGEGIRLNVVRYDTPVIAGFTASASWGQDDMWAVALRYAGELGGFKLAAGIGYRENSDANGIAAPANVLGCTGAPGLPGVSGDTNCKQLGLSASAMHVDSGLFVTGSYGRREDGIVKAFAGASAENIDTMYYVQAGIQQKWFSVGKTTLFGDYVYNETGHQRTKAATGFAAANGTVWGFGVYQTIDAAAMDFYA